MTHRGLVTHIVARPAPDADSMCRIGDRIHAEPAWSHLLPALYRLEAGYAGAWLKQMEFESMLGSHRICQKKLFCSRSNIISIVLSLQVGDLI